MKIIIVLFCLCVLAGCGERENGAYRHRPNQTTTAKLAKKLTAEEKKVIGEYERTNIDGVTTKFIFLENGVVEEYEDGKKGEERNLLGKPLTWGIDKNGELYIIYDYPSAWIYSINKDTSITYIAYIQLGVRKDWAKEEQEIFKKIK